MDYSVLQILHHAFSAKDIVHGSFTDRTLSFASFILADIVHDDRRYEFRFITTSALNAVEQTIHPKNFRCPHTAGDRWAMIWTSQAFFRFSQFEPKWFKLVSSSDNTKRKVIRLLVSLNFTLRRYEKQSQSAHEHQGKLIWHWEVLISNMYVDIERNEKSTATVRN